MKHARLIYLLFLINSVQAKIDVFSIAGKFKTNDLSVPVLPTGSIPVTAVIATGFFFWKANETGKKLSQLRGSRGNYNRQLMGAQKVLQELGKEKNEQINVLKIAHENYMNLKTNEAWNDFFVEQEKLAKISAEIQKKEHSIPPLKTEFTKLSQEIAEMRTRYMNNYLATIATPIVFAGGWGLWNLFFKK